MFRYLKLLYCLTFFLSIIISCDKDIEYEPYKDQYKRIDSIVSDYYSDSEIQDFKNKNPMLMNDSIQYPHVFYLEYNLIDIISFETNKNDFLLKSELGFYNKEKDLIIQNDTIFDFDPDYWMTITFEGSKESNDNVIGELEYGGKFFHDKEKDSLNQWVRYWEIKKYHNWKMQEYPFDVQKIKFEIISDLDTSMVRVKESKQFKASFSKELSLQEGFEIESIDFKEKFRESSYTVEDEFGVERKEILSVGQFTINVKRSGFSLFIKLFLGAILSLILSISVFYIPKEEFDAKAQISVGAIFAAVGNKYFVDSNTISNVLTVADIINNSVIFLVIFNVFIMIAQRSTRIKWTWLESEKNAVKFSVLTMTIITVIILIMYL